MINAILCDVIYDVIIYSMWYDRVHYVLYLAWNMVWNMVWCKIWHMVWCMIKRTIWNMFCIWYKLNSVYIYIYTVYIYIHCIYIYTHTNWYTKSTGYAREICACDIMWYEMRRYDIQIPPSYRNSLTHPSAISLRFPRMFGFAKEIG